MCTKKRGTGHSKRVKRFWHIISGKKYPVWSVASCSFFYRAISGLCMDIRADEYRVKWNIPKHIALAGISYLEKQSEYMKARIAKGKLDPAEQIAMMRIKGRQLKSDPDWRNRSGSILKKQYARRDILKNRVWERSPSIKSVSVELKTEAIRRMKNRKVVGEKVQDIADDLNVSISRLYHWLKM